MVTELENRALDAIRVKDEMRDKSCELCDPPCPMQRCHVFCFSVFVSGRTDVQTDGRTDVRTPCVKLMITYRPGPGGSISRPS